MTKWMRWTIVSVGLALFAVYLLIPVQRDLRLNIWTRSGPFEFDDATDAETVINDIVVGGARVELPFKRLKEYLSPVDVNASWPPSEASASEYDSAITPSLRFDVRRIPDNEQEPRLHRIAVRIVDGKQVLQGTLRLKVVNSQGATAFCAGTRLVSQSVEDKQISATVQIQLHF